MNSNQDKEYFARIIYKKKTDKKQRSVLHEVSFIISKIFVQTYLFLDDLF